MKNLLRYLDKSPSHSWLTKKLSASLTYVTDSEFLLPDRFKCCWCKLRGAFSLNGGFLEPVCWASTAQTHLLILSSLWGKSEDFLPFFKHLFLLVLCVNYFLASYLVRTKKSRKIGKKNPLDGSCVHCCGSEERIYGFMVHEIVLDPSECQFAVLSMKGKGLPPFSATYYVHVQTQLLFPLSIFAVGGLTSGDWTISLLFSRVQKAKDSGDASMSGICLDLVWSKIRIMLIKA